MPNRVQVKLLFGSTVLLKSYPSSWKFWIRQSNFHTHFTLNHPPIQIFFILFKKGKFYNFESFPGIFLINKIEQPIPTAWKLTELTYAMICFVQVFCTSLNGIIMELCML